MTASADTNPAAAFDHWSPEFVADPYPGWRDLRERCPVARSEAHGGFWVVSRHADVTDVCHRTDVFSSRYLSIPSDLGAGDMPLPPINVDPPEHARFRRLLQPSFAPARIAELEPVVRGITTELLDAVRGQREIDIAEAFTKPLPLMVTELLLGTPPEVRERLFTWVVTLVEGSMEDFEASSGAAMEMGGYLAELVLARTEAPADDLVSLVAGMEPEDGGTFDFTERVGCIFLLVIAGIDTTWSALGAALWHLARTPDDWRRLKEEPDLLPTAVEELLRAYAPTTVARVVTQDVELGGQQLAAGEMILVPFPSANRDEAEFADGDQVVLDRQHNRHVAFGVGVHRCLGSGLARMEMRVALETVLAEIDRIELVDESAVVWKPGPVRGPRKLPVRVTWPALGGQP